MLKGHVVNKYLMALKFGKPYSARLLNLQINTKPSLGSKFVWTEFFFKKVIRYSQWIKSTEFDCLETKISYHFLRILHFI